MCVGLQIVRSSLFKERLELARKNLESSLHTEDLAGNGASGNTVERAQYQIA
jgi:hypothetical protein